MKDQAPRQVSIDKIDAAIDTAMSCLFIALIALMTSMMIEALQKI